jgi:hypothetical protein
MRSQCVLKENRESLKTERAYEGKTGWASEEASHIVPDTVRPKGAIVKTNESFSERSVLRRAYSHHGFPFGEELSQREPFDQLFGAGFHWSPAESLRLATSESFPCILQNGKAPIPNRSHNLGLVALATAGKQ